MVPGRLLTGQYKSKNIKDIEKGELEIPEHRQLRVVIWFVPGGSSGHRWDGKDRQLEYKI